MAKKAETVGQRLRRLRLERGLSQRELALLASDYLPRRRGRGVNGAPRGVSYAYISRVEAGSRNPSVTAMRALAAALEVTPNELEFGRETDPMIRRLLKRIAELEAELARERKQAARGRRSPAST